MFWWEHLPTHWCRTCSLQRSIVQSVCWLNWTTSFTDDKSWGGGWKLQHKFKKPLSLYLELRWICPRSMSTTICVIITKRRPVVSAGHKGRLPGETRSACKGKRGGTVTPHRVWTQVHLYQESVVSCPLTLRWYLIHIQTFFFFFAELEAEVVHTEQIWAQVLQRQSGESDLASCTKRATSLSLGFKD